MSPPSKKRKEDHDIDDDHDDHDDDDVSYLPTAKRGRGTGTSIITTTAAMTKSAPATTPPPEFLIRGASNMSIDSNCANGSNNGAGGTTQEGRIIRKTKFNHGMARLNNETYVWSKKMMQIATTTSPTTTRTTSDESDVVTAIQKQAVENYLLQSSQFHRRFNRNYGDVIVFGNGELGQLGGSCIPEYRSPRILVSLRGKPINMLECGGLHTLALTNDGIVYSWGCPDEGSLGWDSRDEICDDGAIPSQVTGFYPSIYGPKKNSNGSKNAITTTADDDDDDDDDNPPGDHDTKKKKDAIITQIVAGETQSLALSADGDVYMWGSYKDDENRSFRHMPPQDDTRTPLTGYKDMNNLEENEDPMMYYPPRGKQDWPIHVVDIPMKAKDIAAGGGVNAALLEDDTLVTWGMGSTGELARTVPKMNKKTPMEIVKAEFLMPKPPMWDGPVLLDRKVLSMSCGRYHLLVVTKEMCELNVYSSGLNQYGQLGHGDNTNRSILTKVEDFVGCEITKVSGGEHFSCFVDITGREIYTAGRGDYGQLGITLERPKEGYGENRPCRVPLIYEPKIGTDFDAKVNCIKEEDIIEEDQPVVEQISCGSTHVLLLTKDGDAFSWGFGESGACGHGKSDDDVCRPRKLVPKLVKTQGASTYKFQYVSGGGQHSACIVKTGSTGFVAK